MSFLKNASCIIPCLFIINSAFCTNIQVNFGADLRIGCNPLYVHFTDSSTIDIGNIASWQWDFGDGYTSNLQHPAHVYQIPGSYDVSLTVTGNSGDTSRITKTDYIYSAIVPQADFIPKPSLTTLDKPIIEFINRSQNETANTEYNWNFDDWDRYPDGGTSKIKSPVYKFSDTGIHNVLLVAINEYDCIDSTIRQVLVLPDIPPLITFLDYPFLPQKLGEPYDELSYYPVYNYLSEYSLEVFNINGQRVFFDDNSPKGWTGNYMSNGKFTPNGLYIVRLSYLSWDNTWHEETKKVFLINTSD